jgi:hypothetical protein
VGATGQGQKGLAAWGLGAWRPGQLASRRWRAGQAEGGRRKATSRSRPGANLVGRLPVARSALGRRETAGRRLGGCWLAEKASSAGRVRGVGAPPLKTETQARSSGARKGALRAACLPLFVFLRTCFSPAQDFTPFLSVN